MKSSTSAKFRSAWIPPAVAQAPIVTRRRDLARTSWIRSASCGRGDRALDQREVIGALDRRRASPPGSRRPRSAPASDEQLVLAVEQARAGSRRRRRTSRPRAWAWLAPSHSSRTPRRVRIRSSGKTGPSLQTNRAELAVAAVADGALHVALHRDVDALGGHARGPRVPRTAKRIITSGPQISAVVRAASKRCSAISVGHHARRCPSPVAGGSVDRVLRRRSRPRARPGARRRRASRRASGRRRASATAPVAVALGDQVLDCRPKRRQPDAASDHNHIPALGLLERPGAAERPAHAERVAAARTRRSPESRRRQRGRCEPGCRPSDALTEIGTSPAPNA